MSLLQIGPEFLRIETRPRQEGPWTLAEPLGVHVSANYVRWLLSG